ncbi:MAG: rRNA maturation RNase YbeY [Proteobacteria bacterium]|nr:rRNA maturation RNase YbeY [Pseudomonadota bacterium]
MIETNFHLLCPAWEKALPDAEGLCERAALASLQDRDETLALSIVLVDDTYIRDLNRYYRNVDSATNVLAFCDEPDHAAGPGGAGAGEPRNLGDVFVAFETTVAEARNAVPPISLEDHLNHLVVHGVLHLCGFDHECDVDAAVMESREIEILSGLGVNNPYMDTEPLIEAAYEPVPEQG